MEETLTIERLAAAAGTPVYSSDATEIGEIKDVFYDRRSGSPEWIGIGTGFFGVKRAVVPVAGAELRPDGFHVPFTEEQVRHSPHVHGDEVAADLEAALLEHYALARNERDEHADDEDGRPRLIRWTEPEPEIEAEVQRW